MNRVNKSLLCWVLGTVFAASPAFGYKLQYADSGDVVQWKESCLKYSISNNGAPGIEDAALHDTIRASFDAWENVDCSYFYFEETDDASCDDIGFVSGMGNLNVLVFRTSNWFIDKEHDPAAIALTTTSWNDNNGQLLDADLEFNAENFDFSVDGTLGKADLQNTATHEIGHMVGLDHSSVDGSTMAPSAGLGDTDKRTLAEDDIDGLCALYPVEDDPDICLNPHCGLDLTCSSTDCDGTGVASPKTEVPSGCGVAGGAGLSRAGSVGAILRLLFQ